MLGRISKSISLGALAIQLVASAIPLTSSAQTAGSQPASAASSAITPFPNKKALVAASLASIPLAVEKLRAIDASISAEIRRIENQPTISSADQDTLTALKKLQGVIHQQDAKTIEAQVTEAMKQVLIRVGQTDRLPLLVLVPLLTFDMALVIKPFEKIPSLGPSGEITLELAIGYENRGSSGSVVVAPIFQSAYGIAMASDPKEMVTFNISAGMGVGVIFTDSVIGTASAIQVKTIDDILGAYGEVKGRYDVAFIDGQARVAGQFKNGLTSRPTAIYVGLGVTMGWQKSKVVGSIRQLTLTRPGNVIKWLAQVSN